MVNKEQAIINFLRECPTIQSSPLFFNFINAKPDNKQIVTTSNEVNVHKPYIDGSVLKKYTFTVIDFRSVVYQAVVDDPDCPNENVQEFFDIQGIIDWVDAKADAHEYPDFGNRCHIEVMRVLTDNPVLNGVDTQVKPSLAKYSFSIQLEYIDSSKAIEW